MKRDAVHAHFFLITRVNNGIELLDTNGNAIPTANQET